MCYKHLHITYFGGGGHNHEKISKLSDKLALGWIKIIKCKVLNITRAGLRATYAKEEVTPITVFIARDHHFKNEYFAKIKEEEEINIKVIGIRYELHDKTISVLGELKIPKKSKMKTKVIIE